jgi:hypothetical protein
MRSGSLFPALIALFCMAGCHRPQFAKQIVGTWESAGTPSSTAIPEEVRNSGGWSAEIQFRQDGLFTWTINESPKPQNVWEGTYTVEAYALEIHVSKLNGVELPEKERLRYAVRQQGAGSIRLPLPQDWTGPSVDYFPKR